MAEAEIDRLRRREADLETENARLQRPAGLAGEARIRFLEALLESAIDYAIIAIDLDGIVTTWNEGARRIFGWSEQDMIGRPASTFFTLEDRQQAIPQVEMHTALHHGRGSDERWHLRKDGSLFWANGEMMPLRDEVGSVQGFIKILRDRTAQRLAAEKQRTDAEFMRSVLAASDDCIKVLDLDANLVFMSEGGQRVMEVSDFNAIRGCPWPDFWHGTGNVDARAAVEAARQGGTGRFVGQSDTMAGTPKWWDVQVTAIRDAEGRPEKILSVSRDITAMRRAEQALREAVGLNALIMSSSRDCTVVLDLDANTLFVSPGGIEAMEIADVDAILGLSWLRVWTGSDQEAARKAVADARQGGIGRFQGYCPTHRGTPKWWDVMISPLIGPDGRPEQLVSVGRDITELKQAEERQRLLAFELSHRMKNTLSMVQAIANQTMRSSDTIEAASASFTARLIALGRAQDILTQTAWAHANLRDVLDGALSPHGGQGPRFRCEGPDLDLSAKCALAMSLALHELATNAAKYGALSNDTGHVEVTWRSDADPSGPAFRFEWREVGGPPVTAPTRSGFGSKMIERSLAGYFNGTSKLVYEPDGLVFTLLCFVQDLGRE